MEEIVQIMGVTLEQFRKDSKLMGFIVIGFLILTVLAFGKKLHKKERELFLFSVVCFCFFNPISVFLYEKLIPDSSHYMELFWLVPVSVFLPMIIAKIFQTLSKKRDRILLVFALCIIFLLSGSQLYVRQLEGTRESQYGIVTEVEQVLDLILKQKAEENNSEWDVSLLAVDEVMFAARNYDARFILPYGRDILDGTLSYYIHDYNSTEMQELHSDMLQYDEDYDKIFQKAQELNVEYIVLGDQVQKFSGNWYVDPIKGKLILTQELIDQMSLEYESQAAQTGLSYGYEQIEEDGPYLIFRQNRQK